MNSICRRESSGGGGGEYQKKIFVIKAHRTEEALEAAEAGRKSKSEEIP